MNTQKAARDQAARPLASTHAKGEALWCLAPIEVAAESVIPLFAVRADDSSERIPRRVHVELFSSGSWQVYPGYVRETENRQKHVGELVPYVDRFFNHRIVTPAKQCEQFPRPRSQ